MLRRDYYVILGVPRTESEEGIRAAFDDLARHYHPDRAGPEALPLYQELVEAYRVLSSRESRRSYDAQLEGGDRPSTRGVVHPPPSRPSSPRARRPAEPMVPEPVSVLRDFTATRPSWDEVFERFRGNFIPGRRQPQGLDALRLDVVIGPAQAAKGGMLELAVPVFFPCEHCRGAGRLLDLPCTECQGSGMCEQERPARLFVPPMVRDGATFQLPLAGLGIRNLYLEVRIRVAG
jgi:molecular chaperone DnaJ